MTEPNSAEKRYTRAEVAERVKQSYQELIEKLRPLSEEQLSQPGPSGWAIKDHLTHLAVWERSIADLLQGRERFGRFLVNPEGKTEEEVNETIYQQYASMKPAEAFALFESAQKEFLEVLDTISDDDLYRPYSSFLPPGASGPEAPVLQWIVGNTFGHNEEHIEWIDDIRNSQENTRNT